MKSIPVEYGRIGIKRPEARAVPDETGGAPATVPTRGADEPPPRAPPKREPKRKPDPDALATLVRASTVREYVEDASLDCEPWEHRSPHAAADDHHTDPITLNGCTLFQQSPPVATRGSRPARARGKGATKSEVKADAARLTVAVSAGISDRARKVGALYDEGQSYAEIAEALGLSVRQVERDLYQRRRGMRALVVRERGAFE